jgi:hypothetical protein
MNDAERINLEAETADKGPEWPVPLPKWWWPWCAWRDGGGIPAERPTGTGIPKQIPAWAWKRYLLHGGTKRPPAPSRFGGVGLFTAWDPGVILRKRPKCDWVAVTTDLFNGEPGCSPTMAAQLRVAGYRLHAWESRMEHGVGAAYTLSAEGYIGQAESQQELDKCLGLATITGRPKALVGNPTAWTDDGLKKAKAAGWELILECYTNEQPWLQPDSKGYPVSSFCYGLYPVSGHYVELADYRAALPASSWSGYVAEEFTEETWHTIGVKP